MRNWTPTDPGTIYRECARQASAACYCEYKGVGPCYRKLAEPRPYSMQATQLRRRRDRERLALGVALAGLLIWVLGPVAMVMAWPLHTKTGTRIYGLAFAETLWLCWIVAVIIAHAL